MAEIRVQDEQGNIHVFPDGSSPEMIAKVMNVKPPAPQQQPQTSDRIADSLQNATISAPEPGLTGMLDRAYNRLKTMLSGGGRPEAAVNLIGGAALGPIRAAKGVTQLPDHPIRGVNNIIGGVGQTIALPAAVVNPATLAYAAPAVETSNLTQKGLTAMGADPDYAELGGNIAGIAAGGLEAKPEIAGKGLVKAGNAVTKYAPMAGKAAGHTTLLGAAIDAYHTGSVTPVMYAMAAPLAKGIVTGTLTKAGGLLTKAGNALMPDAPEFTPAPMEATPSPYRMSGDRIQDAVTVTPRAPFQPKGLLNAAPDEDATTPDVAPSTSTGSQVFQPKPFKATSPKTAQTEILKNLGIAAPSATLKPLTVMPRAEIMPRPDLSFAGSNSGEEAALNQLSENYSPSRLGINDLRGIAQARGIDVDPGDTHAVLIGKIADSLSDDELDRFDQARMERMQPNYALPTTIAAPMQQ